MTFEQIKALRENRARLVTEAGAILDAATKESRALTTEEEQRFDTLHADADKVKAEIDRAERQADLEAELRSGAGREAVVETDESRKAGSENAEERAHQEMEAFRTFVAFGPSQMTEGERAILSPYQVNIRKDLDPAEQRVLATGTPSAGGYTIPVGFRAVLEEALKAFGGIRRLRTMILRTESGNELQLPKVDDTANEGRLLGESQPVTDTDPEFDQLVLGAYKYSSDQVMLPFELTQDSAFDLLAYLARALATRIGRITNRHFTTGTGAGQPHGAVAASLLGKTGANGQTTSVIYDDLVDLIHSVDPDYRADSEFTFNDNTLSKLRKLKDQNQLPIWQAGLVGREPDRILGYPYAVNQDVASMAASAKSILFGNFGYFIVRDVGQMRVVRLNELYAANDQIGIVAFSRHDSGLLADGALRHYANSAS